MQRFSIFMRAFIGVILLAAVAGCQDELPTATGTDLFPPGVEPTTVELTVAADQFLEEAGRFTDYTDFRDAGFLLVANDFGGILEAHTLARFTGLPATVTYEQADTSATDSAFVFGSGRVVAPVDTLATSEGPVTLQLWSLAQSWDAGSVSWELAVDTAGTQIPWAEPGGTRGRLLAEVTRVPGDSITRDSVVWTVDSLAVAAMADSAFAGLLVTAAGAPARVQLGRLELRVTQIPEAQPDTVIEQTIASGPQEFIFTPREPVAPDTGSWQIGGLRGARVFLRLDLPDSVPTCPPGVDPAGIDCRMVSLDQVQVNEAALLLDPQPVGDAFRPLEPIGLVLRTIGEPELGRQAPLGAPIAGTEVSPRRFGAGSDSTVVLPLTDYIRGLSSDDSTTTVTAALLTQPGAASFGVTRFEAMPRLRILYTLPLTSVEQ